MTNIVEYDKVWINANIAIFDKNNEIVILENSFLAIKNNKIVKIDKMHNLVDAIAVHDVKNKLLTAALIDCHTHLIYGGNRTNEFEQRLKGATYAQITKLGGGIASSIKSTRDASFTDIYNSSAQRLEALIKEGVSVIEIKTGYGLDVKTEIKMLKIAQKLEENYPVHIEKTFLGAHAVPIEYSNDSDAYIDYICTEMLDKINDLGLISAVDAYCENLAFSVSQIDRVFSKAKKLGLNVKLHAEQFSQMGASKLACKYNALSVDHLEYTDESSIKEIAKSKAVAVLLPGAYYYLQETKKPAIDLFRKYQVPMALATDLNPGTSPLCSLHLMMNMGAVMFKMTPAEIWLAVTKNAALALGLADKKGSLAVGFDADFCIWNIDHPRDLVCSYLPNSLDYSVVGGEIINV